MQQTRESIVGNKCAIAFEYLHIHRWLKQFRLQHCWLLRQNEPSCSRRQDPGNTDGDAAGVLSVDGDAAGVLSVDGDAAGVLSVDGGTAGALITVGVTAGSTVRKLSYCELILAN
jgi:hypothetical protein